MARKQKAKERAALFVRIPIEEAERLDRAAFELGASKQDLIAGLVSRFVHPETPAGLDVLRTFEIPVPPPRGMGNRKFIAELPGGPMPVGRHWFAPRETPEVLTDEQAAELLQVESATVRTLTESGELPGRKLGEEWRFSRAALLDWLAHP
jgi:excisionase family DNA binding protein